MGLANGMWMSRLQGMFCRVLRAALKAVYYGVSSVSQIGSNAAAAGDAGVSAADERSVLKPQSLSTKAFIHLQRSLHIAGFCCLLLFRAHTSAAAQQQQR